MEIGLLRRTEENHYIKATSQLGPVVKRVAADGTLADTKFDGFQDLPDRSVVKGDQTGSVSIPTFKRYFWSEHIVGWVLLANVVSLTVKLLLGVALTGTVTTVDLVHAYVVTWLGLIGLIALGVGLLRRRYDGIASLHRYRTA